MFPFLFCANASRRSPRELLSSAAHITRRLIPALDIALKEVYTELPEVQGGWCYWTPFEDHLPPLISQMLDEQLAVVVLGDVLEAKQKTAAHLVREAYIAGGVQHVQQLEGCFSTIVIDRLSKEIFVVSDAVGRRALRYVVSEEMFLVSSHDLPLVATGSCALEFDLISVSSTAAFDWSLQGYSLLKSIQVCRPTEHLKWHAGRLTKSKNPSLIPEERILPQNEQDIIHHRQQMLQTMREQVKLVSDGVEKVFADLTSGMDSRSVVALLLSILEPSKIRIHCVGGEESAEVKVARRLAKKMYSIDFSYTEPLVPCPEDFVQYAHLLAFYMNGDTSSKRAIDRLPQYKGLPPVHTGGGHGGIFRGTYYMENLWDLEKPLTIHDAHKQILSKSRSQSLPWKEPSFLKGISERLAAILEEYTSFSPNGYDLLDLFRIYERGGVWEALTARLPWYRNRWSPYTSPQLIRMGFCMPAPIGIHCHLHETLIWKFMPRAYGIPANQWQWLPLPRSRYLAGKLKENPLLRSIHGYLFPVRNQKHKGSEQIRREAIAGPLAGVVREFLTAETSLTNQLFGRKNTEGLIQAHSAGQRNYLGALTSLVTVECWRSQIQEAYHLALRQ